MSDTSPTEYRRRIDAESNEARRHAHEGDDASRWERLLVMQAVQGVKLDMLAERVAKHELTDESNFAGLRNQVTMNMGKGLTGEKAAWAAGILGSGAALVFFIVKLVEVVK